MVLVEDEGRTWGTDVSPDGVYKAENGAKWNIGSKWTTVTAFYFLHKRKFKTDRLDFTKNHFRPADVYIY